MPFLQEYTMLKELGKGGFATVYKVRHDELGYIRAIRVLNETITNEQGETYKKFLEECKILLRLGNGTHPNIVHIYQPRLLDNKALVEMDYVEGSDLNHYLTDRNGFVTMDEILRFVIETSNALAYCHEDIFQFCMDMDMDNLMSDPNNGSEVLLDDDTTNRLIRKYKIIHNDIHSGNIIRKYDGSFVLLDFGLAIEGESVVRSSRRKNGAPEFKSPEKWNNEQILTEQSDIYSLGIVMYEMLAGQVPFPFDKKLSNQTEAEYNLSKQHQNTPPPVIFPLRKAAYESANPGKTYERDYPEWLEQVIFKCLAKKPEERFSNGKKLYECVKTQMEQTEFSNKEEYLKLKDLNDNLNKQLSNFARESTEQDSHINTLAKQFGAATSELEKIKSKVEKLEQENKKLQEQTQPGSTTTWKILTGIAVVLATIMTFLHFNTTKDIDTNTIEAVISQQKTEIEELQSQNTILQSDLKVAQSKDNGSVVLAQKNQKINDLEKEKTTLQINLDKINADLRTANAEVQKLKNQSKPVNESAALAEKEKEIKQLKQTIVEKDKIIKILQ